MCYRYLQHISLIHISAMNLLFYPDPAKCSGSGWIRIRNDEKKDLIGEEKDFRNKKDV